MPISCTITEPTNAVATFHIVTVAQAAFNTTITGMCTVFSYESDPRITPMQPLIVNQYDLSPLFNQASFNSQASFLSMIEQYLLTTPTFSTGTQVL